METWRRTGVTNVIRYSVVSSRLRSNLLQCFDTVGWVIRPVKTVGRITYIVLVQMLNHAQSIRRSEPPRLAVSVRVHGTERRGALVDRRDRVVTWRCRSSSMYGGTEVERALCVMTAILYWMRCWTGSQWRDFSSVVVWTHLLLALVWDFEPPGRTFVTL